MYLTCPNCETVYAVRASMLREGQGEVRCGTCRSVFNALDCLSDELPERPASQESDLAAAVELEQNDSPTADIGLGSDTVEQQIELPPSTDIVPSVLQQDLQQMQSPPPSSGRNIGLWLAAMVLMGALGFQYLWFAPQDLSRRFPMVKAQVEAFCIQAGCMTRRTRAPELVRVLSRDVRAHPDYEGALLVTATFSNAATWAQPFPGLRFSLYDVNGKTIAARTFLPEQYLAGILPPDAPLPPGQPVQVALEILAPEQAAVSFEFTFM